MPQPDVFMGIGSNSHARQTAQIMIAFEDLCLAQRPDWVVVVGDVNSTVAAALVAAKLNIPVAHVEAGLRSFDRTMPEEVNRIVTDHLSTLCFTTEESGNTNLHKEGIAAEQVHLVGNCMVDTLLAHVDRALNLAPWQAVGVTPQNYALLTLHRPANVDDAETLQGLLDTVNAIADRYMPVIFPVHPRTRQRLQAWQINVGSGVHLCDPLPYLTFLGLMARAQVVLTDSGGIQEETTALSVPCLTLRWNTERPLTVTAGTNRLVGTDPTQILQGVDAIVQNQWPVGHRPPFWDGYASQRIVDILCPA